MKRWLLVALAALGTAGLIALGVWQLERRVWKLALIERVEQRVHAPPVAAPGPAQWPGINRENSEYLHVTATGHFLPGHQTLVRAVTEQGGGYWVMAPFETESGFVVLVNRGFVPPGWHEPTPAAPTPPAAGPTEISGLLRISEPKGAFLHANAPAEDRWYSRDVAAISQTQKLTGTAPYFIDAGKNAADESAGGPIGGLTVISFRNSHLSYALTWFGLALMVAFFGVRIARHPQ